MAVLLFMYSEIFLYHSGDDLALLSKASSISTGLLVLNAQFFQNPVKIFVPKVLNRQRAFLGAMF